VNFILRQKQLIFTWESTLILIYFLFGTAINSDSKMHNILWALEFRKTNIFGVVKYALAICFILHCKIFCFWGWLSLQVTDNMSKKETWLNYINRPFSRRSINDISSVKLPATNQSQVLFFLKLISSLLCTRTSIN
jgi:hypothetical protein